MTGARSASARLAFASSETLCTRLYPITGSMTFNWKLPDCPATVMVVSLPVTWAQTIATDSGITGFTLPGMMLEPGCSATSEISPRPASGPLFIQRRSLAIFIRLVAITFNWPLISTAASWLLCPSKKFSMLVNGTPVIERSSDATRGPKPS